MTKAEKKAIIDKEYFAYYSGYAGIELKDIEYGIEDYITYVAGVLCSKPSAHRSKVYYSPGGRDYIRYMGNRIYLDECIRRGW